MNAIAHFTPTRQPLRGAGSWVKSRRLKQSPHGPCPGHHPPACSRPMIRFNLFGIPVRVEPWFWLTMAFLGGALSSRSNSREGLLMIALFMLAGFISILVHELGHALAGRKFGTQPAITLQAFGGYAEFRGGSFTRTQDFIVTAAGPGVQLVFAGLVFLIVGFLPRMTPEADYFTRVLIGISIIWALLNLLPILPLDGGRLLNAILGPRKIRVTLWTSIVTACIGGVIVYMMTGRFLFPLFMAWFAWESWKSLKQLPTWR